MGNKIYCHPLTIADSKSRFLFTAKGHYKENFQSANQEFTKVFRKLTIGYKKRESMFIYLPFLKI
jgi:hypothetical protein